MKRARVAPRSPDWMTRSANQRFDEKWVGEPNSGCWLWDAAVHRKGYGAFQSGNGLVSAHRFSWERVNGPLPVGVHVLHKCDVSACVNPDHLFIGSNADNVKDAIKKGRTAKGEKNGQSKLTVSDVLAIRASGESRKEIASKYGICTDNVSAIKRRISWKDVE